MSSRAIKVLFLALFLLSSAKGALGVDCGSCSAGVPCSEQFCQFCNEEAGTCEDCCQQPVFLCPSPCITEDGQCRNFSGDTCNMIPEIPADSRSLMPWVTGFGLLLVITMSAYLKRRKKRASL